MAEILESLRGFIQYTAALRVKDVAEQRVKEFADKVLRDFSRAGGGDPAAFMDPDFQAVVQAAQMGAARSSDETVSDALVSLISDRSKQQERSRLALTLNDAVEIASVLTKNEFAELSLIYFVTQTLHHGAGNLETFIQMLHQYILPFVPECTTQPSSYSYLESKRCVRINTLQKYSIKNFLNDKYGGIFCLGFSEEELNTALGSEHSGSASNSSIVIPCINDSSLLQVRAINKDTAKDTLEKHGITGQPKERLIALYLSKFMSAQDAARLVKEHEPRFGEFETLWEKSIIGNCVPTTVGTAIGHSNLRRVSGLDAELSTWIS
ncbi:MAG: hypothetical protein RJQ21_15240, partial [Rhodospirillales bacterium]